MVNVRRKLLALLSAAALTACASSAAFAEGFGVYEWSAAGTAMGEAYMFGEEDPSVLAYNPAQITKLDGTYFSIGASLVNPDTKVLFRQLGPLVGGHGQNEVWENEYDPAVIPYMYYATKAGKIRGGVSRCSRALVIKLNMMTCGPDATTQSFPA